MIFLIVFIFLVIFIINPLFGFIFFILSPNKYKLFIFIFASFIFSYQYFDYKNINSLEENKTINILVLNDININKYNTSFIGLYNNQKYLVSLNSNNKINYGDNLLINIKKNEKISNQFSNQSSFNAQKYYGSKKIFYKLNCEYIKTISQNNNIIFKIRNYRQQLIENNNNFKNGSYINALVLGEKNFSDEENNLFSTTGILHILTISGSHLIFLLTFIDIFFVLIQKQNFYSKIFKLIFIPFYFFLAGSNLPIFRASCFQLLNLFFKFNKLKLTNIIAFFIILINPFIIYNDSFLLTFIIAYTLILFKPKDILNLNIILYSVLLPITLNFCYNINPVSFLLNLFIVPFVSILLLPISFILCFFKINFLFIIYDFLIFIFKQIITFFSWFNLLIGGINIFNLLILLIFIFIFFKYQKKIHFFILIFILLITPHSINLGNKVNFIDIGQGDAFLIQSFNKNILIDTGPESSQQELNKYLLNKKINKIDYLFISHFDIDHCGNLLFLYNNFKIINIISSYIPDEYNNLPITKITKHSNLKINNLTFELYPPQKNYENDNNNSLVILIIGTKSILFTGDIEYEREKELINLIKQKIDILKIAHHGSKTSTSIEFLEHIKPKLAILSYGINNRYNHPSSECLNNLSNQKIKTYHICIDGDLNINI